MEQEELIGGVTKGVAEETEVALWSIVPGGGQEDGATRAVVSPHHLDITKPNVG